MSYDNLSSVSQNVLKFYQQLTSEERRDVLVMEIGWTDVGTRGYILVSCAHSNTSFYLDLLWHFLFPSNRFDLAFMGSKIKVAKSDLLNKHTSVTNFFPSHTIPWPVGFQISLVHKKNIPGTIFYNVILCNLFYSFVDLNSKKVVNDDWDIFNRVWITLEA